MSKAERALIALSRAQAAVNDLTDQIGKANEASHNAQTANGGTFTDWLQLAWQYEHDDDGERYFVNHDGDIHGYLSERCPHLLLAHQLVQQRKKARRALGVAKGRVTTLANKLAMVAGGDHA